LIFNYLEIILRTHSEHTQNDFSYFAECIEY